MKKSILVVSVATLLSVLTSSIASADNRSNGFLNIRMRDARSMKFFDRQDAETSVTVNNNAMVTLRGAKVVSVSGSMITASETLGPVTLTWAISTSGSTQLQGRDGKAILISDFAVGDTITTKGSLQSGSTYALNATLVRNVTRTLAPTPAPVSNSQQIFEGTLTSTTTSTPATITMNINGTSQAVALTGGTTILNKDWNSFSLASFVVGDTVRVFGFIPSGSSTVNALVLRNTSR
jgi:hypothetical protein